MPYFPIATNNNKKSGTVMNTHFNLLLVGMFVVFTIIACIALVCHVVDVDVWLQVQYLYGISAFWLLLLAIIGGDCEKDLS